MRGLDVSGCGGVLADQRCRWLTSVRSMAGLDLQHPGHVRMREPRQQVVLEEVARWRCGCRREEEEKGAQ